MADEISRNLPAIEQKIEEFKNILDIDKKKENIKSLQLSMSEPTFWNDQKKAQAVVEELKNNKDDVESWQKLHDKLFDLKELLGFEDESLNKELESEFSGLTDLLDKFELRVFLSGKFDSSNAIVEINAGAGGTEACDWSLMLYRMYYRWAEIKNFKLKVLEELRGDEAGIKSITFLVTGHLAYGFLKGERGVHRLVRISPFDSNKRRHTSFASVDVIPEVKGDIEIEIKPEDLKIDTFRASGAGGQHVNVTDSAVRITHLPTGIVVGCQNERSQHQNKHMALMVLKAKLYEIQEKKRQDELDKMSGTKQKIEWGSQIRSYVLCPYLLVKDHRTNYEEHDAQKVLDGNIDNFMLSYLKESVKG